MGNQRATIVRRERSACRRITIAEAVEPRHLLAAVSIDNAVVTEGHAGTTAAAFVVTLHEPPPGRPVSVDYFTTAGTAIAPFDFQAASGTVTFQPGGPPTQTISVPVNGDTFQESTTPEYFTVTLTNPSAGDTVAGFPAAGFIIDDDEALLTVENVLVAEGDAGTTDAEFTVTRSGSTAGTSTVQYVLGPGTATSPADFTAGSGTLTFAPGVTRQTVSVPVSGDALLENNEWFSLVLQNPTNATLPGATPTAPATATATIVDDDASTVTISDAYVVEGDGGTSDAVLTVTRRGSLEGPASVGFRTTAGTAADSAAAGDDFVPVTGSLAFAPGEATKEIRVAVVGDTLQESAERLFVDLVAPAGSNVTTPHGRGEVWIPANDAATFVLQGGAAAEGDAGETPITFTVRRLGSLAGAATLHYTAPASSDYAPVNGTVTFGPGYAVKTFAVAVAGDVEQEADQTFTVTLSHPPAGGNGTIATATAEGIIIDDDESFFSVVNTAAQVNEGNSGTRQAVFTVLRFGSLDGPASVRAATSDGSSGPGFAAAMAGSDYAAVNTVLQFAPGEASKQVVANVLGDPSFETNEQFTLNLSAATNATVADASAQGWIASDDGTDFGGFYFLSDATVADGDAGTTAATFMIRRLGRTTATQAANYVIANSSPENYEATSGSVTFAPGETEKAVTVNVIGDQVDENNRTWNVSLSPPPTTGGVVDGVGRLSVIDDDTVRVYAGDAVVVEGDDPAGPDLRFTVRRFGDLGAETRVNYRTIAAGANPAVDFEPASGVVTFAAGDDVEEIVVRVLGDGAQESVERVRLELTMPSGAGQVANGTVIGGMGSAEIIDDDASWLYAGNITLGEGTGGAGATAAFTVTRLGSADSTATVDYVTDDGFAWATLDYTPVSGTVTFAPGVRTQTVTVPVLSDAFQETFFAAETFDIDLTRATNAAVIDRRATAYILDDDLTYVGLTTEAVTETDAGGQHAVFTLTRFGSTAGTAQVTVELYPTTATAPGDFTHAHSTVTFAPGETTKTVLVPLVGDSVQEPVEEFFAQAHAYDASATPVGPNAVVRVIDDDRSYLFVNDVTVLEGSPGGEAAAVFTVSRFGDVSGGTTAAYVTENSAALPPGDYGHTQGTLTFAPGETSRTISVPITADDLAEGQEGFNLYVTAAADDFNGTLGDGLGRGTILDDDDNAPPTVTAVHVAGSAWRGDDADPANVTFKEFLAAAGLGSVDLGYPVPGGAAQLATLPWNNLNRASITFSRDVLVQREDLSVRGTNRAEYAFAAGAAGFAYDPATRTATWTFASVLTRDRIILDLDASSPDGVRAAGGDFLDGEWSDGAGAYPSGNGAGGGDFLFRLNVLPGDADRANERVNSTDITLVRSRQNRTSGEVPPAGLAPYSPFADLDGSGRINATDVTSVRSRLNDTLGAVPVPAGAPAVAGSITRSLFGTRPILG